MRAAPPSGALGPRIEWVDSARGIGIVLVVAGHAISGLQVSGLLPDTGAWLFVVRFIYAFHMPLFFFLSGLFVLAPAQRSTGAFLAAKLRSVVWPYLLWSVLQTLLQIGLSGATNAAAGWGDLFAIAYRPIMQFWFLHTLFLIQVVFALLVRAGASARLVLALACALFAVSQIAPLGSWEAVQRVAQHMLYFAAGPLCARWLRGGRPRIGSALALSAALLGWVGLATAVGFDLDPIGGLEPVLAGAGIAASVLLAHALERGAPSLRTLGQLSLQIYVAHTIASAGLRLGLVHLLGVTHVPTHVIGGIAVGLLFPVWLARRTERLGWNYAFTFPKAGGSATLAVLPSVSSHG